MSETPTTPTSAARTRLQPPRTGEYRDHLNMAVKHLASGHGGTIEVPAPELDYLYDIAVSLRRLVELLEESRG
jgi:hypothetical protein